VWWFGVVVCWVGVWALPPPPPPHTPKPPTPNPQSPIPILNFLKYIVPKTKKNYYKIELNKKIKIKYKYV